MNTNKIGKYFLGGSLIYLVVIILILILFEDSVEYLSGTVKVFSILFLLLSFFTSITMIYYNSSIEKRRKAIIITTFVSVIFFSSAIVGKLYVFPGTNMIGILGIFLFLIMLLNDFKAS